MFEGHPPAAALFATNARYKRESYRGSEFAPRILAENGIQVVMKVQSMLLSSFFGDVFTCFYQSDHPVLNSRHLIYEAQQGYCYGLPENLALLSVTGTPATIIGQDHRVGFIKKGYDAGGFYAFDYYVVAMLTVDGCTRCHFVG